MKAKHSGDFVVALDVKTGTVTPVYIPVVTAPRSVIGIRSPRVSRHLHESQQPRSACFGRTFVPTREGFDCVRGRGVALEWSEFT
jgi:hypothetical protein